MPTFSSHAVPHEQVKIVRISDRPKALTNLAAPLPAPNIRRWVTRRKAQVVAAVRDGLLSFDEACERYSLSEEEFKSWIGLLDNHGVRGLRATRSQDYRYEDEQHVDA
jgi:hypothetical protein